MNIQISNTAVWGSIQIQTQCSTSIPINTTVNGSEYCSQLNQYCQKIIEQEGGEGKSERAKQAQGLKLLIRLKVGKDIKKQVQTCVVLATKMTLTVNYKNLASTIETVGTWCCENNL